VAVGVMKHNCVSVYPTDAEIVIHHHMDLGTRVLQGCHKNVECSEGVTSVLHVHL
jgi:hypothetical protein